MYNQLPAPLIAPTSITAASLIDFLTSCKRDPVVYPSTPLNYHTGYMIYDEISAFLPSWKAAEDIIPLLTVFYDPDPYHHTRRTKEIDIRFQSPQLNMLSGTQPKTLLQLVPHFAWGQGLMSRIIMVYSKDTPPITDMFDITNVECPRSLVSDYINFHKSHGEVVPTKELRELILVWLKAGEEFPEFPKPKHPKFEHYLTRRRQFLLKLMLISVMDRSAGMKMDVLDFNRAIGWLLEAEQNFDGIFDKAETSQDSSVQDEVLHFVRQNDSGDGVRQSKILNYIRHRVNIQAVMHVLPLMEASGQLKILKYEKGTGQKWYKAP